MNTFTRRVDVRTAGAAVIAAFAVAVIAWQWPALHPHLREVALWLYAQGTAVNSAVSEPLNRLRLSAGVSLLAPLLLGLMAATAPCQLSTGAAALAFVSRDGRPNGALQRAAAYLAGRVLFYVALGVVVMYALGGQLEAPGPFLTGVRRVLGPLMLIIGLVTLGVLRPRFDFGGKIAGHAERWARSAGGTGGAFSLGLAFSLAFCPTLFFLFFGLTLPLAVTVPLGFLFPAVFALGMTLPLLGLATLVPAHDVTERQEYLKHWRGWRRWITPVAGVTIVLAGLYDTFVYWLL